MQEPHEPSLFVRLRAVFGNNDAQTIIRQWNGLGGEQKHSRLFHDVGIEKGFLLILLALPFVILGLNLSWFSGDKWDENGYHRYGPPETLQLSLVTTGSVLAFFGALIIGFAMYRRAKYEEIRFFTDPEPEKARYHEIQMELVRELRQANQRKYDRWEGLLRRMDAINQGLLMAKVELRDNPTGMEIIRNFGEMYQYARTLNPDMEFDAEAMSAVFDRILIGDLARHGARANDV